MSSDRTAGSTLQRWLLPALLIALLIGAWQLAATNGTIAAALNIEEFLFPTPSAIASSLWENRSLLAENAWVTLREIAFGLACAIVVGLGFAVAMHLSRTVRYAAYPLVVASQTVPIIVIAPILVVWFGFGIVPKLAIVTLICFFPITVAALGGLRSVDPAAIKLMRSLYASRWQTFRRVEAPTALPATFAGVKIAVAVAPIAAVFAEWAGSSSGLGHMLLTDLARIEVPRMFAAVAVLSAIAMLLYGSVALAERRLVTWR